METFRVVTWNLWWRFGDWERRLDAIRAVLTELQPDICGFQEVWTEQGRNQAEVLAAEFGMYGAFAPAPIPAHWRRDFPDRSLGAGNAVISRWPIHQTNICQLPSDEGRNLLHAAIDAPAGRIDFFTTQLTSKLGRSADRCAQVTDVAKFIAQKRTGFYPPILTGDFNAEPDSDEMRQLGAHLTKSPIKNLVLIDAWRYAEPSAHGLTWDRRNPHVRDSLEPSARIDYVMVGPPAAAGRGHVEFVRVFGDGPVGDVWPSDHAGVVADLRV
jgi:endonuclease/exonuclease/phosphatase family metal-dependent hydrolase